MIEEFGPRPAGDVASRSIRITLGGQEYVLAVLFIAGNERWREYERSVTTAFVGSVGIAKKPEEIVTAFNAETDMQLDVLYAYDTDLGRKPGVLPPREELKELVFEDELGDAIAEVVNAANPKVYAATIEYKKMVALMGNDSSTPTSSPPTNTAGRSRRSAKH